MDMKQAITRITMLLVLVVSVPGWAVTGAETGRRDGGAAADGQQSVRDAADEDADWREDDLEAASEEAEEDEWAQNESDRIEVDEAVVNKAWNQVPFDKRYFDYTDAELKTMWPRLMRALLVPYPSAAYLKRRLEAFPELREELGPEFDGDYEALSREILHTWRLFFRGDLREAKEYGKSLGAFGKVPAYFAQIIYAVYLCDTQSEKHQLLQDTANQVHAYTKVLKAMKSDPEFQDDYVTLRLGYAYAIARIAEEVPPTVALMRNYLPKVSGASKDVLKINPEHPVGLAFRAGIDANLIRTMGKAAGRLTFGASQSRAESYFGESFNAVDDIAIIHYEFANALLYMNRKRDADEAMLHLEKAAGIQPLFSMEALDAMYAYKRMKEVEDFMSYGRSFRAYERKRRKYVKETDENLYNVLKPPFLVTEFIARRD